MKTNYKPKRSITDQNYENYWALTVEYSDIYGVKFNNSLKMIIDFIDSHPTDTYNSDNYHELTELIENVYQKRDSASTRKTINQFVKLGFVKPHLTSYDPLCRKFLNERLDENKKSIFSKIFYENATLMSSAKEDYSSQNEVKFLLKTMAYHPLKQLSKDELIGLMCTPNIRRYSRGYMTYEELQEQVAYSKNIEFDNKKYNQISYLCGFLKKMDNISFDELTGTFKFTNPDDVEISTVRDPIRYSIYRTELKNESRRLFGNEVCYIDLLPWQGLVTSHIKDSAVCLRERKEDEAYDYENGLLLNQQNDMMFDHYNITITDDGRILTNDSQFLGNESYLNDLKNRRIDSRLLTENRKKYLVWHRNEFNKKLHG